MAPTSRRRTVCFIVPSTEGGPMTNPNLQRKRPLRIVVVTVALALVAGVMLTAEAAPGQGQAMGGAMDGSPMAPGHLNALLDRVGASTEQRSQIQAIMAAARADTAADREAIAGLRTQIAQLFVQPTVDARAVETLRQQWQARLDQTSKRMTQAMLEASRVFSVEQRRQIAELMAQRRAMHERHRAEQEARGEPAAR
jgi:periplasmic protein CpxP/Spy